MDESLCGVAAAAAAEAGGLDPGLLGGYLGQLASAADDGRRLDSGALADARAAGGRAADDGVPLQALVDLFLSATWRAWRVLPAVADATDLARVHAVGEAVLRAADDAVAAAADGYQTARRWVIRREEAARREFVDDLLTGTADAASLLARAEQFGLDLAAPHTVVVASGPVPFRDATPLLAAVEAAAVQASAGAGALVTTKDGQLVAVLSTGGAVVEESSVAAVLAAIERASPGGDEMAWRCGVGRTYRSPAGIRRSYDEARDSVVLADRLRLPSPTVHARDLLVYRVLLRDREAITDLVDSVLAPLQQARGGAGPLLETLGTYLEHAGNATATARTLHLSVRAVTYRLARIRDLTGQDPTDAQQRYVLQTALIGAHALHDPTSAEPA
jgi:hypothetical protein